MLLEARNLTIVAGSRVLLRHLDWTVSAGQCWCVIGRNGAGKTTLLRHLAGLAQPQSGSILIRQREVSDWSLTDLARVRSFLPQGRNDAFAYRAIDTVLAARHPYHDGQYWESAADRESALTAMAALDVADLAERDVRSLSGGERQRVALAAQLAQDAQCMLLDEPATGLDLSHQIGVMRLIALRCAEQGKAVVLTSHDLNLAVRYATHALLIMPDGEWLAGPAQQTMQSDTLSRCLDYPLQAVEHAGQTLFLPKLATGATELT